jgi:hypothetical protein
MDHSFAKGMQWQVLTCISNDKRGESLKPRSLLYFTGPYLIVPIISVLASIGVVRWMHDSPADLIVHSVTVMDRGNHVIAYLGAEQTGPERGAAAFTLYDNQHRKRASLFVERASGAPDLYLFDTAGNTRAALNLYDSGIGNLDYGNGANDPISITRYTPQGNFQVTTEEIKDGRSHVVGMLDFSIVDSKPRLSLVDEQKRVVWHTP